MDLRNLCSKIDVDSIRAKLPEMPALPANPFSQIKLAKSISKLKSRKIFRSSRENVNGKNSKPDDVRRAVTSPPPPPPPRLSAEFINHTPKRISTISSLINQNAEGGMEHSRGTYCSAYSIDDDYPSASAQHYESRLSRPISPVRAPASLIADSNEMHNKDSNMTLLQKLQNRYKEISEFRFKHVFAKKVVVRKDAIEVDNYVQSFVEDRMQEEREQAERDSKIADNYGFRFKTSRQNSGQTHSPTSNESSQHDKPNKNVQYQSDDESGMEQSPLRHDLTTELDLKRSNLAYGENGLSSPVTSTINKQYKSRVKTKPYMERKTDSLNSSNEEFDIEDIDVPKRAKVEKPEATKRSSALYSIKHNIQRLQRSSNPSEPSDKDNESDGDTAKGAKVSRTAHLSARLRKFKSQDSVEDASQAKEDVNRQPVRVISNKLKTWKKSFKKQISHSDEQTANENASVDVKVESGLLRKFKDMRKKPLNSEEPPQESFDEADVKKGHAFEQKFTEVRNKTFKKMQQINLFNKHQEDIEKDGKQADVSVPVAASTLKAIENSPRHWQQESEDEYACEEEESIIYTQDSRYNPRTTWSTKPIYTDSMESDSDSELPRVLIHQDNSDAFESTLIIAVTRSAVASPMLKHRDVENLNDTKLTITEITAEDTDVPKNTNECVEWIPNKEIITKLLNMTPPPKSSSSSPQTSEPERRCAPKSVAPIHSEADERPWQVSATHNENLYKTKSIDIFQKNSNIGIVCADFDDFENELRDEPILCIADNRDNEIENSTDNDTSESVSSKVSQTTSCATKPQKEHVYENRIPKIGNSRESLIVHLDEYGAEDSDEDRPPSTPPSPPPAIPVASPKKDLALIMPMLPPKICAPMLPSQPPPKVPERKFSTPSTIAPNLDTPPLPASKPPALPRKPPPRIIERTASTARIVKPLVKTSSLRLSFDEEVKPADVGKVNKLITRFEKRPKIVPIFRRNDETAVENSENGNEHEQHVQDRDELEIIEICDTRNENFSRHRTPDSAINMTKGPHRKAIPNETKIEVTEMVSINVLKTNDDDNGEYQKLSPKIVPKISRFPSDRNANYSCASSEYGSPPEYPSSLIGSAPTTPVSSERQCQDLLSLRRSRRSMTRDDDKFLSFDSDEENSYYSISSTGSSRYVVEI